MSYRNVSFMDVLSGIVPMLEAVNRPIVAVDATCVAIIQSLADIMLECMCGTNDTQFLKHVSPLYSMSKWLKANK